MITRWEKIVKKTAEDLGRPYEEIEAIILQQAKWIRQHAINPNKMETDLFGVGFLSARYGKMLKRIETLSHKIGLKRHRMAYYESVNHTAKVEELTQQIETFEGYISRMREFIELKSDLRESIMNMEHETREDYAIKRLEVEGIDIKEFQTMVKTTKLIPTVRKKYVKKKSRFGPRGPYKGKRHAKRRPGWKPPQIDQGPAGDSGAGEV